MPSFTLKGVNVGDVISKYFKAKKSRSKSTGGNTVVELTSESSELGAKSICFFDSKKYRVKIWPVMIDMTNKGQLPVKTKLKCRNCTYPFDSHPIGCPIDYVVHSKRNFAIANNVKKYCEKNGIVMDDTGFFVVEALFCSWNCMFSYIIKRLSISNSTKYQNALSYAMLMRKKIAGIKGVPDIITPAPPIEMLTDYGGPLNIEMYRESFEFLQYEETTAITRPWMFSASPCIEEIKT